MFVSLNSDPYEIGENGCDWIILLRSIPCFLRTLKFVSVASSVSSNLNGGFVGSGAGVFMIRFIWFMSQFGCESFSVPCDTSPLFGR